MNNLRLAVRLSAFAGFAVCASAALATSITPVPDLPGGTKASIDDMSSDGSTLVARFGNDVYRYRNGSWQSLGGVAGLSPIGVTASHNGDFIVGTLSSGGFRSEQVHVHRNGAWVGPAQSQPFEANMGAFISADGSRLLTNRNGGDFTQRRVYQWNGTTYATLSESAAFPASQVLHPASDPFDEQSWFGMSNDGLEALSTLAGPVGSSAVRFGASSQLSFTRPSSVTPGPFWSESSRGNALSGNGQVVYGIYQWSFAASVPSSGASLFRWTAATGTTLISPVLSAFGTTEVSTNGDYWVLSDGSVYSHAAGSILTPAQLFTASNIDFTNWASLRISQVSGDGLTFAGVGNYTTSSGTILDQAWIATIPSPTSLSVLGIAGLATMRRRR